MRKTTSKIASVPVAPKNWFNLEKKCRHGLKFGEDWGTSRQCGECDNENFNKCREAKNSM